MKRRKFSENEGGRTRPPFAIEAGRLLLWRLALLALCLALPSFAFGQARFHRALRLQPPDSRAENEPQDPAAVALIKLMLSQQAAYAGEQVTERGGRLSRQEVRGLKGRLRMDFIEPPDLAGDVMLITHSQYRYYHKNTNVLDIALWPTHLNMGGQEKRIADAIRQKRIAVQKVGEEIVAGRNAAIVQLQGGGRFGAGRRFQSKFWIDKETGVKLGMELSGPRGLVSRSYFTRITIGPAARVSPKDFSPAFLQGAQTNPLFPPQAKQLRTVAEARPLLPFTPLEPATLPPGFRLAAVWVFPGPPQSRPEASSVLLRYSEGVTSFVLYERPVRANGRAFGNRGEGRSIQRWQAASPSGPLDITYIGHLAPEQARAVRDSLR
jgi:hypothetical protein